MKNKYRVLLNGMDDSCTGISVEAASVSTLDGVFATFLDECGRTVAQFRIASISGWKQIT